MNSQLLEFSLISFILLSPVGPSPAAHQANTKPLTIDELQKKNISVSE